jgi:hypothetical protein
MRSALVAVPIAVACALAPAGHGARAAGIQAHLECRPDGGAPLKAKSKAPLDVDLWCSIILEKGTPPQGAAATLWLSSGEKSTTPKTADLVGEGDLTYWQLGSAFVRGTDFAPCGDFVAHGKIATDKGTAWEGTMALSPKCAPAKKLKGTLSCASSVDDGTLYKYPGNGAKKKPRLGGELDCQLDFKDRPPEGTRGAFVLTSDGKKLPRDGELREYPPGGFGFVVAFTGEEYAVCAKLTVEASALSATGQVVAAGKLDIVQTCGD